MEGHEPPSGVGRGKVERLCYSFQLVEFESIHHAHMQRRSAGAADPGGARSYGLAEEPTHGRARVQAEQAEPSHLHARSSRASLSPRSTTFCALGTASTRSECSEFGKYKWPEQEGQGVWRRVGPEAELRRISRSTIEEGGIIEPRLVGLVCEGGKA